MLICRYNDNQIGVVKSGNVYDVTAIIDELPPLRYPVPFGDPLIANLETLRPRLEALAGAAKPVPADSVRFLSPVAMPSKIIGTPANFHAHIQEAKNDPEIAVYNAGRQNTVEQQGLFLKASSSLVGPSEGVTVRFPDRRTDHEAELGVVIGRKSGFVTEAEAYGIVAGYAMALDMVIRGKEDRSFRKSPDSYAVLGPWLVTPDEIADPMQLNFTLRVNDEVRQAANTSQMIISIAKQISWASSVYTLYPGDIIMTGTCQGVGPVKPGDVMDFEFDGIGKMKIPVYG